MLLFTRGNMPLTGSAIEHTGWLVENTEDEHYRLTRVGPICPLTFNASPIVMSAPLNRDWRYLVMIENPHDIWHEYAWECRFMTEEEYLKWSRLELYANRPANL